MSRFSDIVPQVMRELGCIVFEICVPTTEDAIFILGAAAWVCAVLSAVAIAGYAWYRSDHCDRSEPGDCSGSESDTDEDSVDSSSDFDPDATEE